MSIPNRFGGSFGRGCDLGYVEGQNIGFEFRSAEGRLDRLPELAAELVRLNVDVIVTWFTPPTQAAKQATRKIPIVMADAGDPVATGLVASLPRPGGNVTGIAGISAELAGKGVELIRDMLPSARRVTALANATDPFSKPFLEQIKLGGEATGTTINPVMISSPEEFETAFASMEKDRPDAVIVQPSLPIKRAAELALKHRVAAVSVSRWFAEEGGFMAYSARYVDLFRKAAVYVAKPSHPALREALSKADLRASSFEELRQRVGVALRGIRSIAPKRDGLRVYDISLRLGASLGLRPDFVYCYRGAAVGARKLGLHDEVVPLERFPLAFHRLAPLEVEDLLCVLSDKL